VRRVGVRFARNSTMSKKSKQNNNEVDPESTEPDWSEECMVCGMSPTLPLTGMCGPCTFGEAETIGGNW